MTTQHATCLVDGEPWYSMDLPEGVEFVGMEKDPNQPPRYGKMYHPWFNCPCYETTKEKERHDG